VKGLAADAFAVERRGQDHQRRAALGEEQGEQQIDVEAAFVKLVEDHRASAAEERPIPQHHAGRGKHDARALAGDVLVAHHVTHRFTQR
jgi:hypothetical protein